MALKMRELIKEWNSYYILTLFGIALISLVAFFVIEIKAKEPMLPIQLFKIRYFSAASATMIFMTAGMMAASFLLSFFFQV